MKDIKKTNEEILSNIAISNCFVDKTTFLLKYKYVITIGIRFYSFKNYKVQKNNF